MKPRPPTLRNNRRYVLASIHPFYCDADPKQMYYALLDALTSLWGDAVSSEIQMAVISCNNGYLVVRCIRGTEKMLEAAMVTLTEVNGNHLSLWPVATSGTLHALRKRIRSLPVISETDIYVSSGQKYAVYYYSREKVDLFQNDIRKQEKLNFTNRDMEIL